MKKLSLRLKWALALVCMSALHAQSQPTADVSVLLAKHRIPADAVAIVALDADSGKPRIMHRATAAMNPASTMKLVTSIAALERLGPAYQWRTPVYVDGIIKDGTLQGNLYIQGQGDPKLLMEQLWLLTRRVQGLGIKSIAGDIVLDRSSFDIALIDPAAFDGEGMRPYNAAPDALLINFKSLVMTFTPNPAAGYAAVQVDPPLYGVTLAETVPLTKGGSNGSGVACGDHRGALKADFSDKNRIRFDGTMAASCGERVWPVAYSDPSTYAARAVLGMWESGGGKLTGKVREAKVPAGLKPAFEWRSAPLADVLRDVNKFSNNVMAQQIFLTLSRESKGLGTWEGSRGVVRDWWGAKFAGDKATLNDPPTVDNGSGRSRTERISAIGLARLLQDAYGSSIMPDLISSLPISGVDGTLKRSKANAVAHLKTGSLRDVSAVAGYVHSTDSRGESKRYVLVAMVNSNNPEVVASGRVLFDALVNVLGQ